MVSSSSDRDRLNAADEQTNPFVSFRRFADAQMSSLVNNVYGIFQSSPIRRQQAIDEYEAMLRKSRENRLDQPAAQTTFPHESDDAQELFDSYVRARGGEGLGCPYHPLNRFWPVDRMLQAPLIDISYMFTSPYSPLELERQELFREQSGKMRAAFADLMSMQHGQDLPYDNTIEKHAQMNPSDWAADMADTMRSNRERIRHDQGNFDRAAIMWLMQVLAARRKAESNAEGASNGDTEGGTEEDLQKSSLENPDFSEVIRCILDLSPFQAQEQAKLEHSNEEAGGELSYRKEGSDEPEVEKNLARWRDVDNELELERRKKEFRQWQADAFEEQCSEGNDSKTPSDNTDMELDHYLALVDNQAHSTEQGRESKSGLYSSHSTDAKLGKPLATDDRPTLLSTLTTTEQRTLPDGTITTKVVLRKRFSDGAEEMTENVHTQNATPPPSSLLAQHAVRPKSVKSQDSVADEKPKKEKRSGWFWS